MVLMHQISWQLITIKYGAAAYSERLELLCTISCKGVGCVFSTTSTDADGDGESAVESGLGVSTTGAAACDGSVIRSETACARPTKRTKKNRHSAE